MLRARAGRLPPALRGRGARGRLPARLAPRAPLTGAHFLAAAKAPSSGVRKGYLLLPKAAEAAAAALAAAESAHANAKAELEAVRKKYEGTDKWMKAEQPPMPTSMEGVPFTAS